MPSKRRILSRKVDLAKKVIKGLRQLIHRDFIAAGITGSVARGTAEKYSDIDLLIVLRRKRTELPHFQIVENTYCSLVYETKRSSLLLLSEPSSELPELLGGFTKILPIYDPSSFLPEVEAKARAVSSEVFRKSAELALVHSYEDFCRAKNAYLKGDGIVLKDNVYHITHSAALVVAALNNRHFTSDREIFKAYRRFERLPKHYDRIEELRYRDLGTEALYKILLDFYVDLIRFSKKEGISFPIAEETLRELDP